MNAVQQPQSSRWASASMSNEKSQAHAQRQNHSEWSSFTCSLGSLPFLSTTYSCFFKVSWRRTRWSITALQHGIRLWLQLRFDFDSTALRPFDDLCHDRAAALWPKQAVRVATQYALAPLLPRGRPSALRAAEQTQRSSTFPRRIRSHADRCNRLTR